MIPAHWLIQFDSIRAWEQAVTERHALTVEAPEYCGHPEGTLFAMDEGGTIGFCLPDGRGSLLKLHAGFH